MKRNLLSILILALLIVNIVISVIMMLSVNSPLTPQPEAQRQSGFT